MGKMLSFGTLFKGQNDPLRLFGDPNTKSSTPVSTTSAKVQADQATHDAAAEAVNATPVATPEVTGTDALKKKKGTSLATSLGLNI